MASVININKTECDKGFENNSICGWFHWRNLPNFLKIGGHFAQSVSEKEKEINVLILLHDRITVITKSKRVE